MNVLSLREFYDTYKQISPKMIIFSSENQKRHGIGGYTEIFKTTFNSMSVMYSPNTIHFSGDGCFLSVCIVKYVIAEGVDSPLGAVYTIVSGGNMLKNEKLHTIIMR